MGICHVWHINIPFYHHYTTILPPLYQHNTSIAPFALLVTCQGMAKMLCSPLAIFSRQRRRPNEKTEAPGATWDWDTWDTSRVSAGP